MATTRSPASSAAEAKARPSPRPAPVMNQVRGSVVGIVASSGAVHETVRLVKPLWHRNEGVSRRNVSSR
ncbi:hypothetical protein BTZ20_2069 [Rhodococcus sp. MTM3W5.2]|nr:hypothetical protein BTZ20_2069 [Rhodococcus sp. MTM3W5.2]